MQSIIPNDDQWCYLCKQMKINYRGWEVHHMIFGLGKRKLADEDGLTVHLCPLHHRNLHERGEHKLELQQLAQQTWMDHYGKTVDDFIDRYGISYL